MFLLKLVFVYPFRFLIITWPWFVLYELFFTDYILTGHEGALVFICALWIVLSGDLFYTNPFDGKTYWKGF